MLSPHFFAVYINDIVKAVQRSNFGCKIGIISIRIFLYADDIILLSPTVGALQNLLTLCEEHLVKLDLALNANKSVCLRIGSRFKDECASVTTMSGESVNWVDSVRYLGIYIVAAKKFSISISKNKQSYYRSCNAVFSKVGRSASEEVVVQLISSKCLPTFTYGLDACPVSLTHSRTLDFVCTRTIMRIFKTNSVDTVTECQHRFNFQNFSEIVKRRKRMFLYKFIKCENVVCRLFGNVARNELSLLN